VLQDYILLFGEGTSNALLNGFDALVNKVLSYAAKSKVTFLLTASGEAASGIDSKYVYGYCLIF
jgi:hypothetical protein